MKYPDSREWLALLHHLSDKAGWAYEAVRARVVCEPDLTVGQLLDELRSHVESTTNRYEQEERELVEKSTCAGCGKEIARIGNEGGRWEHVTADWKAWREVYGTVGCRAAAYDDDKDRWHKMDPRSSGKARPAK